MYRSTSGRDGRSACGPNTWLNELHRSLLARTPSLALGSGCVMSRFPRNIGPSIKEADGRFTRSNFRHGHYTAKIGGPPVPVTGDGKDFYKAVVRAPDDRTRIETILQNDKPVIERTYRLSANGKSMVTTVRDPKDGHLFRTTSRRK